LTLAGAAASAHASTLSRARHELDRLVAGPQATPGLGAMLEVRTWPVPIPIGGTRYSMVTEVTKPSAASGAQPLVEVSLSRSSGTAAQGHQYTFLPELGFSFVHSSDLSSATVDASTSINPSAMLLNYTASGPAAVSRCRLDGGRVGQRWRSTGTLSVPTFSVVTDTSPFFGTITTPPTKATLIDDPGCVGSVRPTRYQPCGGRIALQSVGGVAAGLQADFLEVGIRGKHLFSAEIDESSNNTVNIVQVDHEVGATTPAADLQGAHRPHGATAHWIAAGDPFMSGGATFNSRGKPVVHIDRACSFERHVHHFDSWRYSGKLRPDPANPMTALFDTGPERLTGRPATVWLRRFLD
jgi:hypothetical protein